ncbi:BTB/POZ protein [Penicillium diatomitis]|uniref:BTB/POZ protein n=1 Tax=Penicillium diatomitis TaxID=2819901 RepID=A0A9W9XD75_9EURO|nr:BTB/POZ protein [Penicillium diatomitis]KAJ5489171.1 BTB/POZ protein [Penicillium diatomitis]
MSELKDVMRDLLLRGRFSDMEILCQGITFKVHQAIVCTQSSYFYSAMCDGFKESIEKAINIEDDTPETMERVLSFLYLREYSEDGRIIQYQQPISALPICDHESGSSLSENKPEISEPANQAAFNNIEVFIAADKYAILPLKTLATLKFSRWANTNCSSPMFHEVVQKVMTSVPPHESTLREVIADIISRHVFDLIKDPEIVHNLDSFGCLGSLVIARLVSNEMVKRPNEYDVLRALVQKINSSRRCRHCAKDFNVRLISGEYLDENFRCASCNTRN